jgi:hypothetical protein
MVASVTISDETVYDLADVLHLDRRNMHRHLVTLKRTFGSSLTTVRRPYLAGSTVEVESPRRGAPTVLVLVAFFAVAALAFSATGFSASSSACSVCGKNLVKNPGAESGRGQNAVGESGAVPHWTNTTGNFGAAAYATPGFWFSPTSVGPKDKGKNYFYGGSDGLATGVNASVGTQTIKVPATAAGHTATLSGWLGNYSSDTAQVRAEFMDASGKLISAIRIGPDTTLPGDGDMGERSRSGKVPSGTSSISIVITFADSIHNADEAGADDISLILS